jgi:hypothetical protein
VLQRIDEPQPRHRWRWAWVAVPLAAAAVVLIAIQVPRLKPPLDATRGGPEFVEGTDATRVPPVVRLKPDATDVRPVATGANRNTTAAQVASSIDALASPRLDVAPLDLTPLEAGVTSPGSIEVEHLETIAPIAVTPLGTDDDSQRPRPH